MRIGLYQNLIQMLYKLRKKIAKFLVNSKDDALKPASNYSDITDREWNIINQTKDFTLTNPERLVSLIRAVDYIESNNIAGSIVECGVWKGGSIMSILKTLKNRDSTNREIYLYDTFEGMSEPTEKDESFRGESANKAFNKKDEFWERIKCFSTLEEVESNIKTINYPSKKIKFIKGKVEDTIPGNAPNKIAILRLDTDWYESTLHELEHLYPRLVPGGVLIIDDYGHWKGCKKAVDEYLAKNDISLLLHRIDYTCRISVKN